MPERDENAIFNETFESIIDVNQVRDAGITSFEDNLREVREHLIYKFIESGQSIDDAYIKRLVGLIDNEWTHSGDIAKVSGRVYLDNEDYEQEVSRQLGEAEINDDTGDIFYLLYEARLRSNGIQAIPIYEDGNLVDFKLAYTFTLEDDENTQLLYAYPDELSRHDYETPTPQQAAIRLEHEWPQQLAKIEKLIQVDGHFNLPRRLTKLGRDLQKDLSKSAEFRELVQIYIDHYIGLDKRLPYIVAFQGEFSYFDGNDPDEPEETEEWNDVLAPEQVTVMGYAPSFRFMQNVKREIEAAFFMGVFNAEDGDEEEYICVSTENIQKFRSTRALRSFMSKASDIRDEILERFIMSEAHDEDVSYDEAKQTQNEPAISLKEQLVHKPDLEIIFKLKQIETVLQKVTQAVKNAQKRIYGSDEEASTAAIYLITHQIQPLFDTLHLNQPILVEAWGEGVRVFGREVGLSKTEERVLLSVELGSGAPLASIPAGESKSGLLSTVIPLVESVSTEDGSLAGYSPSAALALARESQVQPLAQLNGVNIADITVNQKVVAALDGTAEVKLPLLESYREIESSLKKMSDRYGKLPIINTIQRLRDVIFNEQTPDGYVALKNIKAITRMGQRLSEQIEAGRDIAPLLAAIDTLFANSRIEMQGIIYKNTPAGIEETTGEQRVQERSAHIIDIRSDIFNGDLAFALSDEQDGVVYVPFKSVRQFKF